MNKSAQLAAHGSVDGFQSDGEIFELNEVEVETVQKAADEQGLLFDAAKRRYTRAELTQYGVSREAYNREELRARGVAPVSVSCFDVSSEQEDALALRRPLGEGIRRFELPIDMLPIHCAKVVFPPASVVVEDARPPHDENRPGGALRIVAAGRVFFEQREYGRGDWFFVSNGGPCNFKTDPTEETVVFNSYNFFGCESGNRFTYTSKL